MRKLKKRIEDNYLLGCIRSQQKDELYVMPLAWWILNYTKYSPNEEAINREDKFVFRDNIYNVTDDKIGIFLNSINEDRVNINELIKVKDSLSSEFLKFLFYIDFDKKIFVSSFCDIDVEDYLPDSNWEGKIDDVYKYLQGEIKVFYEKWVKN